jgi:uncharacterized phage-like protein YoqJ
MTDIVERLRSTVYMDGSRGIEHEAADEITSLRAELAQYENVIIPSWKREEEDWIDEKRRLRTALFRYGGHEDDCEGAAGYRDPRCTCGFVAALGTEVKPCGRAKRART